MIKKLLSVLLIATSVIFGDVCDLTPCPPALFEYGYNPPIVFGGQCSVWSTHLDYLYLKGRNDLVTCYQVTGQGNTSADIRKWQEKDMQFDWDSGFRVGIDYQRPYDCWDLTFSWTHFKTSQKMRLQGYAKAEGVGDGFTGNLIIPYFNYFNDPLNNVTSAFEAEAHIHFNLLDIDVGREFFVGSCVCLRPHLGLRNLYINHRYKDEYEGQDLITVTDTFRGESRFKHKYVGIGVEGGLASNWLVGCGLGIYGTVSGSLLYSNFDVSQNFVLTGGDSEAENIDYDYIRHYNCLIPTFEYTLGLRWSQPVCDNEGLITVQFGWEGWIIFDQNQYARYEKMGNDSRRFDAPNESPLCLQGLVFGINLYM